MRPSAVLSRVAVLGVLVAAWLLGAAGPAAAHPALVSSSPGAGYAVTDPPREIALAFNEPVTLTDRPLVVTTQRGEPVVVRVTATQQGTGLLGIPDRPLAVGGYEVAYRVVGRDGDLIAGTFAFGVATPVGAVGNSDRAGVSGGGPESVPVGTTALRGLLFLGVAVALGGGWFAWRVDDATGGLPGPRPFLRAGAVVALLAAFGLLTGLRTAGGLLGAATGPGVGRLLGLQAVLLAAAAVTARRPGRGAVAALLLLGVVGLEGARAHPAEVGGPLGAVLTVTHLLAGALWLGGLVHLLRVTASWRGRPRAVRVAAATYARNALVLFVVVSATGTVSAVLLLPELDDWTGTTYGRLLLVKISVFLLVIVLAVGARARLRRTGPAGSSSIVPPAPRRPIGKVAAAETGALAVVVLAAAAVTTVTPSRLIPVSALLAAPVGPTVRVAERVRQVSVSVVASKGRVEIRADAPDDGAPARIRLDGEVAGPSGDARALDLDSCGPTCWTGPIAWNPGTNILALRVAADRYDAGRVSIPVRWPAVPAPGLLRRVQDAMGARTTIDMAETVTSGFGTVLPNRFRLTGQEFLADQSWAEGGATDATVAEQDGGRTLLFALPALGYHFALRLDGQDRIVSERIVTPNHLLTREYSYP
ncbi:MAG: copper resistance CopC/CopD family protein [Mycobacteriales bacterium]